MCWITDPVIGKYLWLKVAVIDFQHASLKVVTLDSMTLFGLVSAPDFREQSLSSLIISRVHFAIWMTFSSLVRPFLNIMLFWMLT